MFDLEPNDYFPLNPESEIENQLNNLIGGGSSASVDNKIQSRRRVFGTEESDTIRGGANDDILNGRQGADLLLGGEGSDIYRVNARVSGGTVIRDTGGDNDRLNLGGANLFRQGFNSDFVGYLREGTSLRIDLDRNNQPSGGDLTIENFFNNNGGRGSGFIEEVDGITGQTIIDNVGLLEEGNENNNTLNGGAQNDVIDGGAGNDNLNGRNGDDRLVGGDGEDTLLGGDGNDELVGDGGDDRLVGGNGDDALLGRQGNDNLNGGSGNDLLNGNQGDDILTGGGGVDILIGGLGSDTYRLTANNASGSSIIDTDGDNDRLVLSGANLRNSYGFVEGQVGYERDGTSLVIDLDESGSFNIDEDLTIEDFFVEGTRERGTGFIEQVDNLSGDRIFNTSPVYYNFRFENTNGDAGVGYVAGTLSLPASVLNNDNPNRIFQALDLKVTEGKNFGNLRFIPSLEDVNWAEFSELENEIRGEPVFGSNEFRVNNEGEITFANFRSFLIRANRQVGRYGDSLSIRFGDQGVERDPNNPLPFLFANLSSLDNDSYEGSEGCATPSDNGDCAFDPTSATVTFERM